MAEGNGYELRQLRESMVRAIARAAVEVERLELFDVAAILHKAEQAARRETDAQNEVSPSSPWQATMR